jgi:hypothetical protein
MVYGTRIQYTARMGLALMAEPNFLADNYKFPHKKTNLYKSIRHNVMSFNATNT